MLESTFRDKASKLTININQDFDEIEEESYKHLGKLLDTLLFRPDNIAENSLLVIYDYSKQCLKKLEGLSRIKNIDSVEAIIELGRDIDTLFNTPSNIENILNNKPSNFEKTLEIEIRGFEKFKHSLLSDNELIGAAQQLVIINSLVILIKNLELMMFAAVIISAQKDNKKKP